ncbi:hypothetical protein EV667_2004 [Ancylobacter aquaticus]|uniref:Uncharacterized protein n=1 Tax=Ancylobacter aquaticus TaxID=100 RepID=A0A4R1HZZ3_ANCAQ|nr:hypothetical protein [Ancylobacter aquaticus]TCK28008.1 hypothetical protein EV667_2004 [Ancylobacter aquaticus]
MSTDIARTFARRLRANGDRAEADKFTVANLSTMSVEDCRALAQFLEEACELHEASVMAEALRAAPMIATPAALPPIEMDPDMPGREYIPLPGGWEVQTKGTGSSYRLLDRKTGERRLILCHDPGFIHDFVTRMAREVHAASIDSPPATGGEGQTVDP